MSFVSSKPDPYPTPVDVVVYLISAIMNRVIKRFYCTSMWLDGMEGFNLLRPRNAFISQWTVPSFVPIMDWAQDAGDYSCWCPGSMCLVLKRNYFNNLCHLSLRNDRKIYLYVSWHKFSMNKFMIHNELITCPVAIIYQAMTKGCKFLPVLCSFTMFAMFNFLNNACY